MKKSRMPGNFYRRKNIIFFLFTVPLGILYILFFLGPILAGFVLSFTDYNGISSTVSFVGLENYKTIFKTNRFTNAIWFNIKYAFLLVVIVIVGSLALALILNKKIKFRSFFRAAYFFPAVLPPITMGLVFNGIFANGIPQIGQAVGSEFWEISLLSRSNWAMYAILFVNVWSGLCIPTVLFLAGLQTVPKELYESAELDGAGKWKIFGKITMPFLLPTLTMVFVLVLKQGLMLYDLVMGMTMGGPAGATESMAFLIYNHGFVERKMSLAMAESMILSLIVCVISFAQIAWSNKRRVYD